jgi:secondary thiamine-phosphate synthase enzyme
MKRLEITTSERTQLIDITAAVEKTLRSTGIGEGICMVFVPHTTAAVTINENADPAVRADILMQLNRLVPFENHYQHGEGNSAAHIKASLIGSSQTIFVDAAKLVLGRWQGIFFCEFDGPRKRQVYVNVLKSGEQG